MHNGLMGMKRFRKVGFGAALLGLAAGPVLAGVQLHCAVTYAGATQQVLAQPVTDPYPVASADVRGRFRFKPVVVGSGEQIDHISIYVYQNTAPQPVLIQQAKYLPPYAWPADGSALPLTGQQHLYAGPMERELIYSCALERRP